MKGKMNMNELKSKFPKPRFVLLMTVLLCVFLVGCKNPDQIPEVTDYSEQENWAYFAEGEDKLADLFLICPTIDMGEKGNYNMSLED